MNLAGIPIITSPYVPKVECFEANYSRPLIVRLCHGRTVDLRVWEEDQVFFLAGGAISMRPETYGVIRGLQ